MTDEAPKRVRSGAPLGLQLTGLLFVSLLAAQAISLGVILLTPPPRAPFYRMAEVASALEGGSLMARAERPMTREVVAELPADMRVQPGPGRPARALALILAEPEERVRLIQQGGSPVRRLFRNIIGERALRLRAPPPPPGPSRGPRPDFGPGGPGGPGPEGPDGLGGPDGPPGPDDALRRPPQPFDGPLPPRALRQRFRLDAALVGEFSAALQGDDGRWTVVRSTPDPFPNDWQRLTILWLLAGFLLVAPIGWLFARRLTAPLQRFADAAEHLGRDPNGPQMTLTGPAEVGAAARAFNEMQARLKRYIGDRTAMVGAISHDLRTPLARIRFKVENAPPAMRAAVLADIEQMDQMIGGVLAFIRDESTPRRREKLDLLSLVEVVADDAALLGGKVEIGDASPLTVEGDPVALQRLFGNLVDNAIKYGAEARIEVRTEGRNAVVRIADRGAGLSPVELEQAFKPFYRADRARNLDNGGVGLGLSIARSTARAHGGDVTLTSGPDGATAIVTLPLAD